MKKTIALVVGVAFAIMAGTAVAQQPAPAPATAPAPAKPAAEPKWNGPYLRKAVPLDPWGKPYVYKQPGAKGDFDLLSYGKDGQPGGSGENADITNH